MSRRLKSGTPSVHPLGGTELTFAAPTAAGSKLSAGRCYVGCIPNSWSVRRNDMTSSRLNMPTTW